MKPFAYVRPSTVDAAIAGGRAPGALFLAGGTSVVDLVRLGALAPGVLVDVGGLPELAAIDETREGIRLGALARNADVAHHPVVQARLPALSEALLSGASPQLRNAATIGGNLLQRTRCPYFRDATVPACNKRAPGSGCAALGGYTRSHAVLGTSEHCIATHPSDMCVALAALDAVVHTRGPRGARAIVFADFHTVPGAHPEVESVLEPGELVTDVTVPATPLAARSTYVKARDRAELAFALASAAVALDVAGGAIRAARVALGGVATKPWRSREAEGLLVGRPANVDTYARAAAAAMAEAQPRGENAFKVALAQRVLVRALAKVGGAA